MSLTKPAIRVSIRRKKIDKHNEIRKAKEAIISNDASPSYLEVYNCYCSSNKGRGIKTKKKFPQGEFVTFFSGKHTSTDQFQGDDDTYCFEIKRTGIVKNLVDASCEDGSFGRIINDSSNPNLKVILVEVENLCYPVFFALKNLDCEENIEYDYGGNSLNYGWNGRKVEEFLLTYPDFFKSIQSPRIKRTKLRQQLCNMKRSIEMKYKKSLEFYLK